MSSEKPWHKHHFQAMAARPISCVVCSQPEDHENHSGRKYPSLGMSGVIKRPDWEIYGGSPPPVSDASRSCNGRVEEPEERVQPYPVAEIDLSQEQELVLQPEAPTCGRCQSTENLRRWGRAEENDPTSEVIYFCASCWSILEP